MTDGSIFKTINKIFGISLIAMILVLPISVLAAMSSTNYYIYADSVETGGGLSSGGVYDLEDTLGEGVISQTSGATYNINAGYQAMVLGSLSMNISNNSIDLGDLNASSVSVASTTVTITTDAQTGYSLSVQSVSGSGLTAVSDGEVTAGQEEYGLAVVGTDAVTTTDQGIMAGLVLANNAGPVIGRQSELVFKAAISPSTPSGVRSQSITVGVSANF